MPIDWSRFKRELESDIADAERQTGERLAGRVSSVTRLTDDEVKRMLPLEGDVERFAELMSIVGSAEARNRKAQRLADNMEQLGGVVVTLLEHLV